MKMLTKLSDPPGFECNKNTFLLKSAQKASHCTAECIFGAACVSIVIAIIVIIAITVLFSLYAVKNEI